VPVQPAGGPCLLHGSLNKRKPLLLVPRMPDFSWYNKPKREKIYQRTIKYTKIDKKTPTSFIARPSKIYPHWDFWFENVYHLATLVCAAYLDFENDPD
jgi:hypothetical protein